MRWKHDIKIARNYNKTNNTEEDKRTRRLADELTELELSKNMLRNLYGSTYNTWSPHMSVQQYLGRQSTSASDLENSNMNFGSAMPNQLFIRTTPKYRPPIQNNPNLNVNQYYNGRRATLPSTTTHKNSSPNKQFEKISEVNYPNDGSKYVGIESLQQNNSESDSLSRSPVSKKFTVTPTDLDKFS